MTEAKPVNWEAVRMLAIAVGVREAARQCGVSESAALQRSNREGWLRDPRLRAANEALELRGRPMKESNHLSSLSPSQAFMAELGALGQRSRLSLARGIAKAGEHVETLSGSDILEKSAEVKAVAQTADLVHGWKDAAPQVKIRLDVLSASPEPVIDVTSESQLLNDWEDASDPLDDY